MQYGRCTRLGHVFIELLYAGSLCFVVHKVVDVGAAPDEASSGAPPKSSCREDFATVALACAEAHDCWGSSGVREHSFSCWQNSEVSDVLGGTAWDDSAVIADDIPFGRLHLDLTRLDGRDRDPTSFYSYEARFRDGCDSDPPPSTDTGAVAGCVTREVRTELYPLGRSAVVCTPTCAAEEPRLDVPTYLERPTAGDDAIAGMNTFNPWGSGDPSIGAVGVAYAVDRLSEVQFQNGSSSWTELPSDQFSSLLHKSGDANEASGTAAAPQQASYVEFAKVHRVSGMRPLRCPAPWVQGARPLPLRHLRRGRVGPPAP